MHRRHLLPIVAVLLIASAGCAGLDTPDGSAESVEGTHPTTGGPNAPAGRQTGRVGMSDSFGSYAGLYERTIDSVVEIRARSRRGTSQGSGFVYSTRGYVVTNQHVVGQSESVQVRFRNGTWKRGTVVGRDVYTDLAVVRVPSLPPGVDPLPIAHTDPVPGQPVVALGSPLGYEGTITHGIVSGINRSMETARGFTIPDAIQIDAPINPGSSGGPLVTMNGTVIGVNRAKRGDNLGFAISADVLREVVPKLVKAGEYHHAFVGIRTVQVTPWIAAANDLRATRGVMVVGVLDGGPAAGAFEVAEFARTDRGGTVPVDGDVIVGVDGRQIRSQQDLAQYLLLHTRPGDRIAVTVLRDGERVTVHLTLGRRPELTATDSL